MSILLGPRRANLKAQTVTIFSVWVDEDETSFKEALAPFAERTGINIQYEGSRDFETLITVRVEGNNAPGYRRLPAARTDGQLRPVTAKLVDLASFMNVDQLKQDYISSWLDLATINDKLYGVFYRASTKSLVWYPVKAFEEKGYKIPETWDELIALSDQIVADGHTPWCIGLEHGGATGWYATDWIEDILLRTAGPEIYDQWTRHEIPFNHPSVKQAAEIMAEIWFNERYVYGGKTGILTIPVADTQTPMFEEPPACWLYRQAGWAPGFFPEGKKAGVDSSFFYLPPIDPAQGKPVLGGGDVFAMFNDRPEVRAVMEYLATPKAARVWIEKGGFISPNKGVPLDWYPNEVDRTQAEIIKSATIFRFDASDLMPPQVGTGTFWKGMVDWVNGKDLDTVLQEIENSWPKTSN
ncbi:MAG: alpha-glucoside ABC transporter substrate-binding protein [Herpetosiphonaceae bacterium]|nr:MAG: alpha-glucoside ABC transporter substrate-binding protein [Herpetosiphonaceae bacterium]